MSVFQPRKDYFLSMNLDEKRKQYACKNSFVTLDQIPSWKPPVECPHPKFTSNEELNSRISVFSGDITKLEIDAIVNAANTNLAGGGGVDGFIHRAAGHEDLQAECRSLGGCPTGSCKITGGYRLPAKYVIHCVGPVGEKPGLLAGCYESALNTALANNIRTIAFPCISTGIYGYPAKNAAKVVLHTVRNWLESNPAGMDRIIFCLFLAEDLEIYNSLLLEYFP